MKFQNTEFYFTVIYGLHSGDRRSLWTELKEVGNMQQGPWLLMGDYNAILYADDRLNRNEVQEQETRDFKEFLEDMGLT